MDEFDVAIIGGGILGNSLAYVLSSFTTNKIALIEKEKTTGIHSSSRNTGVIHRPFYLNPITKSIYANVSQISYEMWKKLATTNNLPWNQRGTIEISTEDQLNKVLKDYKKNAEENGMKSEEYTILDSLELNKLEPNVKGSEAFLSKTDTNVSFGQFTKALSHFSAANGTKYIFSSHAIEINDDNGQVVYLNDKRETKTLTAGVIVNLAGGESLKIAHKCGLARNYALLHFRGDYWRLKENSLKISHNIYTVPKHMKYPFLDPHYIIRPDGSVELGPNAHLVSTPYSYPKGDENRRNGDRDILSKPVIPKLKLFTNREFISLVRKEWKSTTKRSEMVKRMKEIIPKLDTEMIEGRGLSGIRHSLVDRNGFVPEAVVLNGNLSTHVSNYNSPGATGAPAYSIYLYTRLKKLGLLRESKSELNLKNENIWNDGTNQALDVFLK